MKSLQQRHIASEAEHTKKKEQAAQQSQARQGV